MGIENIFKIKESNKRIVILFIIVSIMLLGGILMFNFFGNGSSSNSQRRTGHSMINVKEVKGMLDEKKDFFLLDVRTQEEYREGHIQGSINLPLSVISNAGSVVQDKDATVVVYCRSGARSSQAANALVQMGYQNVFDMGGIMSWPYDVVK